MKKQHLKTRSRRGYTLIETMMGGGFMLVVMLLLTNFLSASEQMWHSSVAGSTTQTSAQAALQRFGPSIRMARRVLATSTPQVLTLQAPAFEANGSLRVPLQDGALLSYYLSDNTGSTSRTGNILWRSVNGTPDRAWSMVGNRGRVTVAPGSLSFSYYPAVAPSTVTVNLSAYGESGNRSSQFRTSEEFKLRNRDL